VLILWCEEGAGAGFLFTKTRHEADCLCLVGSGCSTGWNLFLRRMQEEDLPWAMIVNNDILFPPGAAASTIFSGEGRNRPQVSSVPYSPSLGCDLCQEGTPENLTVAVSTCDAH
jgi:hypothetical protein